MTEADEPPNAENHAGQEEQAPPSPISRPRALPNSCFGLIMGAVALLGLLSAAWWYFDFAAWSDLTVNITIANEKTHPSGRKIDVRVGEKVILNVKKRHR